MTTLKRLFGRVSGPGGEQRPERPRSEPDAWPWLIAGALSTLLAVLLFSVAAFA